jgi:hypothetical protein
MDQNGSSVSMFLGSLSAWNIQMGREGGKNGCALIMMIDLASASTWRTSPTTKDTQAPTRELGFRRELSPVCL